MGMEYAPVIGLFMGGLLSLSYLFLASLTHPFFTGVIVVFLHSFFSGGLHLDGFADTVDGFGSCRSKERILEIMKDSRVGVFGVLGLIFLILIKIAAVYSLPINGRDWAFLLLMPAVGRFCALFSAGISTYARENKGLGAAFVSGTGASQVLRGLIFFTVTGGILLNVYMLLPFLAAALYTLWFTKKAERVIGGVTGDTLGYIIEITEVIFLAAGVLQSFLPGKIIEYFT